MKKNIYLILAIVAVVFIVWLVINAIVGGKADTGRSLTALYSDAKALEAEESYLNAQALYSDILEKTQDEEFTEKIRGDLENLNTKILFSPLATKDSAIHTVIKGDTLGKIAKKFNTTVGLIMRSNNLKSDIIRPGQRLKVSKAVYKVLVDYSDNILFLKSGDEVIKRYVVATGLSNLTPIGAFKIINKLKDPVWYKAGAIVPSGSPENILGSRWLGISVAGYGIHGTTEPETLGSHVTAGCVRMSRDDVEELYDILPIGTEVVIVD
ncbi:MAG: L,D-transpeptidase family protein [Candidatus Omnitrophota bacterium]